MAGGGTPSDVGRFLSLLTDRQRNKLSSEDDAHAFVWLINPVLLVTIGRKTVANLSRFPRLVHKRERGFRMSIRSFWRSLPGQVKFLYRGHSSIGEIIENQDQSCQRVLAFVTFLNTFR